MIPKESKEMGISGAPQLIVLASVPEAAYW